MFAFIQHVLSDTYSEQVVLDAGDTMVNKTETPALMELTS